MIERASIVSAGNRLRLDNVLPNDSDTRPIEPMKPDSGESEFVTDAEFRQMERANIVAALRHAKWRIWGENGAAELLGLNPSTLKYRMKQLGVSKQLSS